MKKIVLFVGILLTTVCQSILAQVNERSYRASEINMAKQQSSQKFMNHPSAVMLDTKGSFIYSSFRKMATNGDFVNYNDNENYTKTISTQAIGDKINLRFTYFSTEANADFLYIYDGPDVNSPLLAALSGNLPYNTSFQSSGNSVTLKFVSNAINTGQGFKVYAFAEGQGILNQLAQKTASVCNSVAASDECLQAPTVCDFNVYCGVTSASYTAGNTTGLGNFCGSIENNSWISFIPSVSNVSFVVTSAGCADASSGIQAIIYDTPDCVTYTEVSNCVSQGSASGTFTITNNVPLQAGHLYYFMIDGFAGNVCSYTISAGAGMIGSFNINTSYPEICAGYTTTLTSSVFSTNYAWTDNFGNTFPNQQSITVSPTVTTTYSLVVDPNSCGITDAVKTVTVNSTLSTPSINSPTLICSNSTVSLTTNALGYNYIWTGPNGFVSTIQNPVIPNFTSINNGTYSLNINIDAGCTANESTKTLTMAASPTVGLISSNPSLCNFNGTSTVTFTASGGSSTTNSYLWNWNMLEGSMTLYQCIPFVGCNSAIPGFSPGTQIVGPKAVFIPNSPTTVCVVATSTNGCVSTSTCISITEASTATVQISGNTNMCRGDSSLITATGSAPFAWTFPSNSGTLTLSSDGDSLWVKPLSPVTYTVKAVDGASCTATRYINIGIDTLCVWPGDTDRDGLVSQNDLLPIGVYYGASGASRPNASLNWEGQYCLPWSQSQTGGVNVKHVDSDGNGAITSADTLAIYQNISLSHALKTTQTNSVNPEVSITFHKPSYNANDTVIAYLHLGVDTVPLTNFYGAAFKFTYDDFMIQSNTARFTFINSWVGTPSLDVVTFNYLHTSSQQFLEAFVRNTHNNVSGYGKFAVAKFLLHPALTSTVFSVTFTDGIKTSNDYNTLPLASVTATVPININIVTGITNIRQEGIYISPNPTNDIVTINSDYVIQKVEVMNVAGQILLSEKAIEKSHQLHLQNFSEGIYFVKVSFNNGLSIIKKVVKL